MADENVGPSTGMFDDPSIWPAGLMPSDPLGQLLERSGGGLHIVVRGGLHGGAYQAVCSGALGERQQVADGEWSFSAFRAGYEWYDDRCITPRRQVINDSAGRLGVREGDDMVSLLSPSGEVLLSANSLASAALRFIARTDAFYVSELPGGLSDEELEVLVATLVETEVLRVAP